MTLAKYSPGRISGSLNSIGKFHSLAQNSAFRGNCGPCIYEHGMYVCMCVCVYRLLEHYVRLLTSAGIMTPRPVYRPNVLKHDLRHYWVLTSSHCHTHPPS